MRLGSYRQHISKEWYSGGTFEPTAKGVSSELDYLCYQYQQASIKIKMGTYFGVHFFLFLPGGKFFLLLPKTK
jgi:hypothetical protein